MIVGPGPGVQHSSANHRTVTNKSYRKPQIDRSLMTFENSFHIFELPFVFYRYFLFLSLVLLDLLSVCSHLRNYFHIICVVISPIDFVKFCMIYFPSFGLPSSPWRDKTDRLPFCLGRSVIGSDISNRKRIQKPLKTTRSKWKLQ